MLPVAGASPSPWGNIFTVRYRFVVCKRLLAKEHFGPAGLSCKNKSGQAWDPRVTLPGAHVPWNMVRDTKLAAEG